MAFVRSFSVSAGQALLTRLVLSGEQVHRAVRALEDGDLGHREPQALAQSVVVKVLGLKQRVGLLQCD